MSAWLRILAEAEREGRWGVSSAAQPVQDNRGFEESRLSFATSGMYEHSLGAARATCIGT